MSTLDALLVIGETAVFLYLLWRLLDVTLDAIGQWQRATRQAEADASLEDAQATEGSVSSALQRPYSSS